VRHNDRTAKSVIFPFPVRKVKKEHTASTAPGNKNVDPCGGLDIPLESHTVSVIEETKGKEVGREDRKTASKKLFCFLK
jgi:hypothetical protein